MLRLIFFKAIGCLLSLCYLKDRNSQFRTVHKYFVMVKYDRVYFSELYLLLSSLSYLVLFILLNKGDLFNRFIKYKFMTTIYLYVYTFRSLNTSSSGNQEFWNFCNFGSLSRNILNVLLEIYIIYKSLAARSSPILTNYSIT